MESFALFLLDLIRILLFLLSDDILILELLLHSLVIEHLFLESIDRFLQRLHLFLLLDTFALQASQLLVLGFDALELSLFHLEGILQVCNLAAKLVLLPRDGLGLLFGTRLASSQLLNHSIFLLQLLLKLVLDGPVLRIVCILSVCLGLRHTVLVLSDYLVQLVQRVTTSG